MGWKKKLATCTALASLAGFTIYVVNKVTYFIATVDNLLNDTKGTYYDWRFGKIYYTKKGTGCPVLLIHDLAPESAGYEWSKLENELARTNTVYTIDLYGCGRSDKPNTTYTNFLYVQLITDFIKDIIKEKTDVIATGESASFTVMACKNDPTVIDKVIMINPVDFSMLSKTPDSHSRILKLLLSSPLIGTLLYNILHTKKNIEKKFLLNYFYNTGNVDNSIIKTYYETAHLDNAHSRYLFANLKGRFTQVNILPSLKDITNSMFILAGTGNPDNLHTALRYKEAVPSIEVIQLPNVKHLPQLEAPLAVLEQIHILFCNDYQDDEYILPNVDDIFAD